MTRDEEILTACKGFLSRYPALTKQAYPSDFSMEQYGQTSIPLPMKLSSEK